MQKLMISSLPRWLGEQIVSVDAEGIFMAVGCFRDALLATNTASAELTHEPFRLKRLREVAPFG